MLPLSQVKFGRFEDHIVLRDIDVVIDFRNLVDQAKFLFKFFSTLLSCIVMPEEYCKLLKHFLHGLN